MKKNKTTIILVLFFFIGLAILIYPSFSNYYNEKIQTANIDNYEERISVVKKDDYTKDFNEAIKYNKALMKLKDPFINYKKIKGYNDILNVNDGMIGYLTIEKINVELPIYHGTSSNVLSNSVGHLKGSSFPTGTTGTHVVLSAHRGLPSAKLFTHLDRLEENDTFTVSFYDEKYRKELTMFGRNSGRDMDKVKESGFTPVVLENGITYEEAKETIVLKKMYMEQMNKDLFNEDALKCYTEGAPAHYIIIGEVIGK